MFEKRANARRFVQGAVSLLPASTALVLAPAALFAIGGAAFPGATPVGASGFASLAVLIGALAAAALAGGLAASRAPRPQPVPVRARKRRGSVGQ